VYDEPTNAEASTATAGIRFDFTMDVEVPLMELG